MVAATVEPVTKTHAGQGGDGRFLPGNIIAKGNALAGRVEKMRAFMLQTCEKRIGEVIDVLFDLAIHEKQKWAIQEILDRSLGKIPEARDVADLPKSMTQVNITLPAPAGREGETVPGLLDDEP